MYYRLDDILDEAIAVSEESIRVLLITIIGATIISLLFNSPNVFLFPPLIASSYFFVSFLRRIYEFYRKEGSRGLGLLFVAPSYVTLVTGFLAFSGFLSTLAYTIILIGFLLMIVFKIIEGKRDFIVLT
ncbi:MAG: hypothetical protein ACPLRJ_00270 [Infirmifilum uzonense]|jgi:hypothetical protein|uniref:Uncharacterized protein n=1 Tax=Infirmifilum uzonense TaxID=1550241 RepID=A0A0F7FH33_9CREN|nr:hypothetical protein [Infirmifilum uzonense]AKG38147.1 hypothetical protein MA03_00985 [Infirmifilum uzonense]